MKLKHLNSFTSLYHQENFRKMVLPCTVEGERTRTRRDMEKGGGRDMEERRGEGGRGRGGGWKIIVVVGTAKHSRHKDDTRALVLVAVW